MTERFSVTLNVFVEATDEDEAELFVERLLAGRADSELLSVSRGGDGR